MNEWKTINVFKLQRNLFNAYRELCNINVYICKCEWFRLFCFVTILYQIHICHILTTNSKKWIGVYHILASNEYFMV